MIVQNPFYHPQGPGPSFSMNIFWITNRDVEDQLRNINPSQTPGMDEISPQILKNISNNSLMCERFLLLHLFIKTKVTLKQGNYRPIALTSILSKIMGKNYF